MVSCERGLTDICIFQVYLCENLLPSGASDLSTNRLVAVKVLHRDADDETRFALLRLSHSTSPVYRRVVVRRVVSRLLRSLSITQTVSTMCIMHARYKSRMIIRTKEIEQYEDKTQVGTSYTE